MPPYTPGGPLRPARSQPELIRLWVQIACPILLVAGLTIPQGGSMGWTSHFLWAAFATAAAGTQLVSLGRSAKMSVERRWMIAAIATAALVGYWVIIVLPSISSNAGFLQTLAAGCAAVGLWLTPGRTI